MAYPATPLDVEVDLQMGLAWVNATNTGGGVLHGDAVNVDYGRGNWAGNADPARLGFTLNNTDGRWSPDLVTSPHFGLYKRNIPCRMGVGLGDPYLTWTEVGSDMASTPNVAAIDLTGDIDIRIDFTLERDPVDIDKGGKRIRLAHKNDSASGWEIQLYRRGDAIHMTFLWWDSGAVFHEVNTEGLDTFLPWTIVSERTALRVTMDLTNGTNSVVSFYTAPTIGGTYTIRFGFFDTPTSLKANSDPLRIGGNPFDSSDMTPLPGRINAFELRNGINGTVVANPTFTTQAVGATSFTDGAGRSWTIGTGGRITNMRWRFHGELASLPVRWDLSGKLVTAPVEATGILRRLRQGDALESSLRRHTTRSAADVVQYWPCEETGSGLTQFGAAVGTAPLIVYAGGSPKVATNSAHPASSALPSVAGTSWASWIDSYTPTGQWQVRWLMAIPDGATGTDIAIMRIYSTDMIWQVSWQDAGGGNLKLDAIRGSTVVFSTGYVAFLTTGRPMGMHLQVTTSGANVSYQFTGQPIGGTAGGVSGTGVAAGNPGQVWHLIVNQNAADIDAAIGHVTLQSSITDTGELESVVNAWLGETAGNRIQRLCLEEGIAYRTQGDPNDTEPMGFQLPLSLAELLQEAADTDGGLLHEARESFAVGYRTRTSMQSQTALVLNYSTGQVAGTPDLDRDDSGFANDITVRSSMGADGRAVLDDESPLSISEPPTGAGRYTSSYDANCLERRTTDLAGWRLRLSTPNEPRVSKVSLETNLPAVVSNPTLTAAILDLGLGDLIQVTNLPATTYTGTVRQLVQGVRETISMFSHRLDLNTTPASPWDARRADVDARYDTAGSILASAAAVNATSISVATLTGPAWTTSGADMPFDILVGGVRVTVTAIGAVSLGVQTFTISALPIARDVGFDVRLADPTYYEL